jgi:hypothetical protein
MAQNAVLFALFLCGYGPPWAAAVSGLAVMISAGVIVYVWPTRRP